MAEGISGTAWNAYPKSTSPTPISPTSSFGSPNTFTAAANQQAGDYDTIMKGYSDLATSFAKNPLSAGTVTPQLAPYTQSADVTNSLAGLSDLATTGGYTPQGIADIRARDISPTRSIYANAQQNVERAKALGGGYSPNYNAVQAKMARDESTQIGDINTNANAGIAQNVAANRLSAAPAYAGASAGANQAETQAGQFNANTTNTVNTGNADRNLAAQFQNRGNILGTLQGQTSLYGTTPALTNTFGNQVVQATQAGQGQQNINQNQQQIDEQKQRDIFGMAGGMA